MSKGELVVRGDLATAMQSFVNAVTYMGGSVTSMNPARPVEFSVKRAAGLGGLGAPYRGTATLVPIGPDQTRIFIELKPRAWYLGVAVLACLVVLGIGGAATDDVEAIMSLGVVFTLVTAATMYLYYVPWRQKLVDKLKEGVHGTVPAYEAAPAPAGPAPSAPPPPGAVPTATSSSIAEQMRQLREMKDQGFVTEAEFKAKKAELLGRL